MNRCPLPLLLTACAGLLLAFMPSPVHAAPALNWDDSGPGFKAGTLDQAGQNLYVNRRGELEVIRRYDLDGNGRLDLLFNSTHDIFNALPATFATWRDHQFARTEFSIDGSSQVLSADLNRDGWNDLVFMPNRQNVQQQRSSIIIAWGGPDGWSTQRVTRQLPVNGVTAIGAADLDDDGWPDLVSLNENGWLFGQPEGRILRVYWGGQDGYLLTRYQDLGIPGAVGLATGHFGADGKARVAVLTSSGAIKFFASQTGARELQAAAGVNLPLNPKTTTRAMVVQPRENGGDGLWVGTDEAGLFHVETAQNTVRKISAAPATHLALGRLDDDEWPDLVLTDLQLLYPADRNSAPTKPSVTVWWGTADGVDVQNPLRLDIPNAHACAIGDADGDGHGDLLVSVYQGTQSLQADSRIYLGTGGRTFTEPQLIATEGAQGLALARLDADSPATAIFANSQHRTLDDAVPLRLYWGVPGGFSRDAFVDIPNLSGYKSSASDLNSDGHVDMIVINGGDISEEAAARAPHTGINIYWGGTEGEMAGPGPTKFDLTRREVLSEKHLGSINVADLDRDGYLDLVLGAFESAGNPDTKLIIYYGSADGFSAENRTAIDVPGRSIGCLVADFNRDGALDIVIGSYATNQVITYWGEGGRYAADRHTVLPYAAPIDLEAADLNADGWLDLIVASYEDSVAHHHDTGSSIFWGGPAGWHMSRSQWLPGMTPLGLAVGDLDGDGWLDLVSPHYHGELSREDMPSYIFWGSPDGFSPRHRQSLIVNSASEAVIADFDQDGKLDLAFAAHSIDPGHLLESPVFYNDGNRFEAPRVQYLPAVGPHYMWVQDIGHISNRRNEEIFTSRVLDWDRAAQGGRITVNARQPHGAKVNVQVRSAASRPDLSSADWHEVGDKTFALRSADRVLQYRLLLQSANGDAYPIVRHVTIQLD